MTLSRLRLGYVATTTWCGCHRGMLLSAATIGNPVRYLGSSQTGRWRSLWKMEIVVWKDLRAGGTKTYPADWKSIKNHDKFIENSCLSQKLKWNHTTCSFRREHISCGSGERNGPEWRWLRDLLAEFPTAMVLQWLLVGRSSDQAQVCHVYVHNTISNTWTWIWLWKTFRTNGAMSSWFSMNF